MLARSLDQRPPLPGCDAVAVAAAVAAALGELHDAGLVHGALDPDRVAVDETGAVSLLPATDPVGAEVQPSDDVAALGRLLAWLAERAPDRPVRSGSGLLRGFDPAELLAELGRRCLAAAPDDRPAARAVADTLHRRLPEARASLPSGAERPARRRRPTIDRRTALGSMAAVALLGAVVAPARCATSSAAAPKPKPEPVTEPSHWADGVLTVGTRRYAVGTRGDDVLVGRWACLPSSVALLRRATGEVVAFDRFADHERPTVGRVVARVPGARRLVRRDTQKGCAALAVATADGRTVPLHWKEAS